jgi:hypothetical protein
MTMTMLLRKWLGPPPSPLTRPDTSGSRIGSCPPMTHGAKRQTPGLNGWHNRLVSSRDAMRAVEVEALVWSTMTGPPEVDLSPGGGD